MLERLLQLQNDIPGSSSFNFNEGLDGEVEYLSLPSKGYFYSGVYKNITQVKVKKLSWVEEHLLSTPSYFDNDTVIEEVLRSVIVDKNFPVGELVEIDRNMILWWLRIGAFGSEYSIPYHCSKCSNKKQQLDWDLTSFTLPEYGEVERELRDKGYIIVSSNDISFFITNYGLQKEKEVVKFIKELKTKTNTDHKTTIKLLCIIKSITYNSTTVHGVEGIYQWLQENKISFKISRLLQSKFEDINLKVKTEQLFVCNSCNYNENVPFPMTKYFFGLNTPEYREHLVNVVNYLNFWGRIDYQSILRMPTHKRRRWCALTEQNIKTLYNIKN
jgi:hypothetical protein